MKTLSVLLIFAFSFQIYSQEIESLEVDKAEECELLVSDLVEAYDNSFNPVYLKHKSKKNELVKLESSLREALESKDKNTRRVVIAASSGVVSVALGYFAFRNIKSALPSVGGILDPTKMPLYWRIILGAGAVGGTVVSITQTRDFFLTKKQVRNALEGVEKANIEFSEVQSLLNDKMCEANELIRSELEANQCASVGFEHFVCTQN